MLRQGYRIAEGDVSVVPRWVHTKFCHPTWLQHDAAGSAWDQFPRAQPPVTQLQQWCDQYLDTPSGRNSRRSSVQLGVMLSGHVVTHASTTSPPVNSLRSQSRSNGTSTIMATPSSQDTLPMTKHPPAQQTTDIMVPKKGNRLQQCKRTSPPVR